MPAEFTYKYGTSEITNTKGSYNERRALKCKPQVGAKSAQTCTGRQITRIRVAPYIADNGNLVTIITTYRHGTVFAPKQCLYQKEAIRRAQKCKP